MIDPIVDEIHKSRKEYAEKFDFDIDAIFEDLRRKQRQSSRKIVSFAERSQTSKTDEDKKAA